MPAATFSTARMYGDLQGIIGKQALPGVQALMDRQYLETPFYGILRMTAWLRRQGLAVGTTTAGKTKLRMAG